MTIVKLAVVSTDDDEMPDELVPSPATVDEAAPFCAEVEVNTIPIIGIADLVVVKVDP